MYRDQKEYKKRRGRNVLKSICILFFLTAIILIIIQATSVLKTTETVTTSAILSVVEPDEAEDNENNISVEEDELEVLKSELIHMMESGYPSVELSFLIKNLDTGAYITYNDKKMNSASLIKLFILETVYAGAESGEYELSDKRDEDLSIMITESNNKAANNFIDDFGGQNENRKVDETNQINKYIKERGYVYTELNRKMYDVTPPEGPSGYQNYTSVSDVCSFLEGIYSKELLKEPYNTYALNLMKNQKRRTKIPAKITEKYPELCVANKTGELSQVENDAAIIMGDNLNVIFVVMTDNIPLKSDGSTDYELKEEIQTLIADMGLKVVDFYKNKNLV